MHVEIVLTPAEIAALPGRDLRASTCVVFDVLRATSTLLTAFANGASRVFPVLTIEEARRLRDDRLPGALLGGERDGIKIEGFNLGNSPLEYTSEVVTGRDLITTTTNGTVALRACAGAREVVAGAWLNLAALSAYLLRPEPASEHLLLVCAGTGSRFALEDGLAAGALLAGLCAARGSLTCDDAGLAMRVLHQQHAANPLAAMQESDNGKRLMQIPALQADVAWCAQTDRLDWIARLRDGALTGTRWPAGA